MTPELALCLPYYKNPGMLAEQFLVWAGYPDDLKARTEIVLVDDASPSPAADVSRPDGLPPLRIFRVQEDIPWHQHGARNLAAHVASAPWLLLTDMDHVVPAQSLSALLDRLASATDTAVFTFARVDAPDGHPTRNERGELKPHVNTYAMRREYFWRVGGYDEDCVGYGTDGYFRQRLWAERSTQRIHLDTIPVVRYPREVIADASGFQVGMDPRAFRNAGRRGPETRRRLAEKQARGEGPKVLAFGWEQVL